MENGNWQEAGAIAGDITEFTANIPAGAIVDGQMVANLRRIGARLTLANEDQGFGGDDTRSIRRQIIQLGERIRPILGLEPGR
jgi:hypothetical protein